VTLFLVGPVVGDEHQLVGHPERPSRVTAAVAGVDDLHLGDEVRQVAPREAPPEALGRVHEQAYLDELEARSLAGGGGLDDDTYLTAASWRAATLAAGAGLAALDALAAADEGVAFVAARPPGHHAARAQGMGFCLLNNVAVAAGALVAAGERVLILDWDVHHGNGTQSIFWDEPAVLYVSTHQWPLYPGTGRPNEVGGLAAPGLTLNLPLPAGATGDVVRRALDEVVAPVVERFGPTWVLVSAGFDGHRADPLGGLGLSSGDFAALAHDAAAFAPRPGRLALFLEGGYDLEALRASVAATVGALAGASHVPELPTSGGPGEEAVRQAKEEYEAFTERVAELASHAAAAGESVG